MDALMANNRALTSWAATRSKAEPDYLTFTAEEANSSVALNKSKDVPELNARLEYRVNKGAWQKYTWTGVNGLVIPLTNIGDTCQFRAEDVNETFSLGGSKGSYIFKIIGVFSASGRITSLLDRSCPVMETIPKSSFTGLFMRLPLTTFPALSFKNAADYCCGDIARNNEKLREVITEVEKLNLASFSQAFLNCYKLNRLVINLKDWATNKYRATFNWLLGVSPTGTFTCPSELPVIFGDSNIPWGWKVDNGLTTVSEEEVLNACYQYKNGQLIIQPDFKECLNKEVQTDYVWKGKVYWKAGTPLPNPHRPDLGEHYSVTSLRKTFFDWELVSILDLREFDLSEVKDMSYSFVNTYKLKALLFSDSLKSRIAKISYTLNNSRNLTFLDFSSFDFSLMSVDSAAGAFSSMNSMQTAYARTQEDADKLNASTDKSTTWKFVVKPQ